MLLKAPEFRESSSEDEEEEKIPVAKPVMKISKR